MLVDAELTFVTPTASCPPSSRPPPHLVVDSFFDGYATYATNFDSLEVRWTIPAPSVMSTVLLQNVKEFQQEAQYGSVAEVKNLASKALPTLQQHVELAKDLNKNKK